MFGRFVDDNFNIKQRLMSFRTAQSSMNAIQIAFVLLETLNSAGVSPSKVLGTNRDGAAVNGLAITHFQEAKPDVKFWNLKCLAHFLNLVSEFPAWRAAAKRIISIAPTSLQPSVLSHLSTGQSTTDRKDYSTIIWKPPFF